LPDYEYEETSAEFEAGGELFRTTGKTVLNLGWQGWYTYVGEHNVQGKEDKGTDEDGDTGEPSYAEKTLDTQVLPFFRQDEHGTISASVTEKMTSPPKPYTYHALIAAMNGIHAYVKDPMIRAKLKELQGIGAEATQEAIISTLFERGYIEKKKKQIFSTNLGKLLIDLLTGGDGKASVFVQPDMTALWEQRMSDIEGGAPLEPFISEVVGMVKDITSRDLNIPHDIQGMERKREPGEGIAEAPCPLGCGSNARRFDGKYGLFWKCRCSPNSTFRDENGAPVLKEKRTESKCPLPGCKGTAKRLAGKKDGRLFWVCDLCGSFFDDIDGVPFIREKKSSDRRG
jgi:DNA topoisomerase-3